MLVSLLTSALALFAWYAPFIETPSLRRAFSHVKRGACVAARNARELWALTTAAYRLFIVQRVFVTKAFVVYKATAYHTRSDEHCSVTKNFSLQDWEEHVEARTPWSARDVRVDVRYMSRGQKYRLVLRHGDVCAPITAPCIVAPRGVLAAELRSSEGQCVDITRRLIKYQGPHKDFHASQGLRVAATDMFPSDDQEELRTTYESMRVTMLEGMHITTRTIPMDCEDVAAFLRLSQTAHVQPTPPPGQQDNKDTKDSKDNKDPPLRTTYESMRTIMENDPHRPA